jgi:hypothetical protein
LFVACGEADFFSAFGLVSGTEFGSELSTAVALIFFSPFGFFADEMSQALFFNVLPEPILVNAGHLSGELTKCPVKNRMVAMSYSRLCPHL